VNKWLLHFCRALGLLLLLLTVSSVLLPTPDCVFDPTASTLTVGDKTGALTHREGKLLAYFAERPNTVLPRTDINDAVWGSEGIITGRSLDVFVSRLRKKLAVAEGAEIKTVHGVGYRLVVGCNGSC
jgi:DNA-binding response OmpR family regulator